MSHEERENVSEAELLGLFRRRRPDPAAFRAGVARRIAEARRASEERAEAERRRPPVSRAVRRAAALLALDPLDATIALGPAGAPATKLLPAALALPALLLGSVLGAVLLAVRSLARTARGALPPAHPPRGDFRTRPDSANRELRQGGRLLLALQLGTVLVMLSTFAYGGRGASDVLLGVLLVSVAALVVTVRGFAREGWLSREEVARLCAGLLTTVLGAGFLYPVLSARIGVESDLGVGWTVCVLLAGEGLCLRAARGLAGTRGLGIALGVVVLLFNPLGCTHASRGALRDALARFHGDITETDGWGAAAAAHETLRALREEPPDPARQRGALEVWIEQGAYENDFAFSAAARMDWVDAEHWRWLAASDPSLPDLLDEHGRACPTGDDEYLVPMLLARRELDEREHAILVARIERCWPLPESYRPLVKVASCVRQLERMGRVDRIEARRGEVDALLRRHWVAADGWGLTQAGGFSPDAVRLHAPFVEDTWAAIELMARFGVPDGIDLREVRGFLRGEARALVPFLVRDLGNHDAPLARAALVRLEEELGVPPRGFGQRIVGERLFLGAVLLVALCLVALRLAPPVSGGPSGAQP